MWIESHHKTIKNCHKDVIKSLTNPQVELLDYYLDGRNIWCLTKNLVTDTVGIVLGTCKKKHGCSSFLFNTISEDEAPDDYNCPSKFIKMSTNQNRVAIDWRKEVVEHKSSEKIKLKRFKTLTSGKMVIYNNKIYKLIEKKTKGWRVTSAVDKKDYLMLNRYLKDSIDL